MNFRKLNAPTNTVSRDMNELSERVGNVYETVMIVAKRANQISAEVKVEIEQKLADFGDSSDHIEEVFENREQIEISRYFERMPKPSLLATQEFIEDQTYYRNVLRDKVK